MTFNLFSNYDLLTVGIVLCILLASIIIMLAKVLCRGNRTGSPKEKKEGRDAIGYAFEPEELAIGTSFEELVKNPKTATSYKTIFFVNADVTSRTGKMINIRKTYHERILKIIQVIGNNEITMFSYIDNVLKHHLDTYQDEITELYNKNNKGVF